MKTTSMVVDPADFVDIAGLEAVAGIEAQLRVGQHGDFRVCWPIAELVDGDVAMARPSEVVELGRNCLPVKACLR